MPDSAPSEAQAAMGTEPVIGIDLGGTAIKLARFTAEGELLAQALPAR